MLLHEDGFHRDAGEIFINEKKAAIANPNDAYALGIGMVHQHFMLVNQLTVLENIILGKESAGVQLYILYFLTGFLRKKGKETDR